MEDGRAEAEAASPSLDDVGRCGGESRGSPGDTGRANVRDRALADYRLRKTARGGLTVQGGRERRSRTREDKEDDDEEDEEQDKEDDDEEDEEDAEDEDDEDTERQ